MIIYVCIDYVCLPMYIYMLYHIYHIYVSACFTVLSVFISPQERLSGRLYVTCMKGEWKP